MIEVKDVTKSLGATLALDKATLTVPTGSVLGLVGPNGAGKSTLINHIAGIYRPDAGEVLVDGEPTWDNARVKERLFCIHDTASYWMNASLRDMKRLLAGMYPRFSEERYARLSEAFPTVDERTPLRRLSRGMVKQAFFRLALSCRPDVLLLDEPVDGLDPVIRRRVWSLIANEVSENGTTVLISSHNLRELEDICDHVGIIDKGRVVLEGSVEELQSGVCKVQALFAGDGAPADLGGIEVLHESSTGRMRTYVVRAGAEEARGRIEALGAQYVEVFPLSLEELFIYELGGADHVADILL